MRFARRRHRSGESSGRSLTARRAGAHRLAWGVVATILTTLAVGTSGTIVEARDAEPADAESAAQQLVERFAPIIMVKEQSDSCDTEGEPYLPTSVDVVLDNPEVALRQVGRGDVVMTWAPSARDLAGLGEGFFIDFPGSSLTPGCIYERDFEKYSADDTATIYAHIVQPDDAPDHLVVQYWFYWYYNDWNNKHESDWEGISLLFEASSVDAALASAPVEVGYAQHEGGERADWDSSKLSREGDRPVVYSSAGSHASYFQSEVFLGRGPSEGFGCDDTTGPSVRVAPSVVLLPDAVDDPDSPLAWLSYDGRWGERQSGAFNGPTGPTSKERWDDPMPWFDELRPSSVVIPAGNSDGVGIISTFCDVVEFGSRALISFTVSPTRVLIAIGLLAVIIRYLVRRTDWSRVSATPVVRRRRIGQILRAAATTYRRRPLQFMALGLLYLPASVVVGAAVALARVTPVLGDFLRLAQPSGGTNLLVALLAGNVASAAAFVGVNALVADHLRLGEENTASVGVSSRITWGRRIVLAGAALRSVAIVTILFASVVGIPWGIRQLVRYQFVPHAIVHEGADATTALRRSSELVRGRWFHTALACAAISVGVLLSVSIPSLLLLVGLAALPLWLFSGIVTMLYVVATPLAAIAMNLLYGDAVAAEAADADAEGAPSDRSDEVSVGL